MVLDCGTKQVNEVDVSVSWKKGRIVRLVRNDCFRTSFFDTQKNQSRRTLWMIERENDPIGNRCFDRPPAHEKSLQKHAIHWIVGSVHPTPSKELL